MDDYRLRPATVADLPMILQAERDYIAAVEPEQMPAWAAAIDRNLALWIEHLDHTTVLEFDDRDGVGGGVAGFVMWMSDADDDEPVGPVATLITVQVLPAHRRRGLGRRLLDVFAGQARDAGARTLRLGVHERNPARSLYPKAGYTLTGREDDYLLYELTGPPAP